jgi:hypothetical protein
MILRITMNGLYDLFICNKATSRCSYLHHLFSKIVDLGTEHHRLDSKLEISRAKWLNFKLLYLSPTWISYLITPYPKPVLTLLSNYTNFSLSLFLPFSLSVQRLNPPIWKRWQWYLKNWIIVPHNPVAQCHYWNL